MTKAPFLFRLLAFFMFVAMLVSARGPQANSAAPSPSDPWSAAQTIPPADFVKELQQRRDSAPVIIYVGFRVLYSGAHIPGAVFHGPGSTEQGLADLKKFAATLPKESNVVIYCGCCPLDRCPNLRPAFTSLNEMGFTHLRVLILPTSFAADWVEKGYPVEKGS
jgi:thiosulfate/3-mercaptopyruvate sulfurtransferase